MQKGGTVGKPAVPSFYLYFVNRYVYPQHSLPIKLQIPGWYFPFNMLSAGTMQYLFKRTLTQNKKFTN
jgi:hypothetical protein